MAAQTKQRRRRRRSPELEAMWRARVEACEASGLGVRGYAREHGISENSIHAWRRELRRRDVERAGAPAESVRADGSVSSATAPSVPAFVPVRVGAGDAARRGGAHSLDFEFEQRGGVATVRVTGLDTLDAMRLASHLLDAVRDAEASYSRASANLVNGKVARSC